MVSVLMADFIGPELFYDAIKAPFLVDLQNIIDHWWIFVMVRTANMTKFLQYVNH